MGSFGWGVLNMGRFGWGDLNMGRFEHAGNTTRVMLPG
jgi:hypothetical protein